MPFSTLKRVCSCPYLSRSLSGVPAGTPKCILSDTRCMDGVLLAFQGAGKISIDCDDFQEDIKISLCVIPSPSMLLNLSENMEEYVSSRNKV